VAGFGKEDITISVQELQLTVEGELEASEEKPVHKGIATRDFKQNFALAEYVVVKGAELKDGLLTDHSRARTYRGEEAKGYCYQLNSCAVRQ
jgi:molecular chaperone IbpA